MQCVAHDRKTKIFSYPVTSKIKVPWQNGGQILVSDDTRSKLANSVTSDKNSEMVENRCFNFEPWNILFGSRN
jgi:hypothetical protein